MNWLLQMLSHPIALLFALIIVGDWISKIKVRGISLGVSAILIISIIIGAILSSQFQSSDIQWYMKSTSSLGSTIFSAIIALFIGKTIAEGIDRKSKKYFWVGTLIISIPYFALQMISKFNQSLDKSALYGVFCGAVTNPLALSSMYDISDTTSGITLVGYGCTYLLGVIGAALGIKVLSKQAVSLYIVDKQTADTETNPPKHKNILFLLSVTILIGYGFGKIKLPFIPVSLGFTCGVVFAGIILGWVSQKVRKFSHSDTNALELYYALSIRLLFIGHGVLAGTYLVDLFQTKLLLYGIAISSVTILLGTILCKWVLRMRTDTAALVIAGVMTISPALGIMIENNRIKVNYSIYSMSYIGALITSIIIVRF